MSAICSFLVPHPLRLHLKGERDYLRGTDILLAILDTIEVSVTDCTVSDIDIVFHRLVRSGLTLIKSPPPDVPPVVKFSCSINGDRCKFSLIEDGRTLAGGRPYCEDEILNTIVIEQDNVSASSSGALPHTDLERWVAMLKVLHMVIYSNLDGKWLFVRGKLTGYFQESGYATHRVVIEANFNNKLTRSAVLVNGRRIGEIFFSLA
jgi:hypothetical protein